MHSVKVLTICEGSKRDFSEDLRDINDFLLPLGLLTVVVASLGVFLGPYGDKINILLQFNSTQWQILLTCYRPYARNSKLIIHVHTIANHLTVGKSLIKVWLILASWCDCQSPIKNITDLP